MAGTYAPNPVFTGWDDNGDPISGGLLYTYAAGTTTPLATWPNVNLTPGTENANPVVLDAAGRATLFLSPTSYKFILKTAAGATVWTRDNIGAVPPSSVNVDIQGLFGVAADAGELMYLSDGSGALTAGSWYKADADLTYASVYPELAFAVDATAAGATGTLRKDGQITLSDPLTPGEGYYVSATAGDITATAPATNMRYVGQAQSTTVLSISVQPTLEMLDFYVLPGVRSVNDFRLSLTTAVPVTTADVTAAATLYWTPYTGNAVSLYTGATWKSVTSAQLSVAAPAAANQMYDVFVDYNDGTPQLLLLAWTNDTTRATALTTQDGILVKTGDTQQRYVGSVRTVSASQFNDSEAFRHVWNYYNRVTRKLKKLDTTASWTWSTAAWQQARAQTANQLDFVVGVSEDVVEATLTVASASVATAPNGFGIGIGLDSAATISTDSIGMDVAPGTNNERMGLTASYCGYPGIGRHILTWMEFGNAGVVTFYGVGPSATGTQSGLLGWSRQ